ncbi:MAG: iron transporter [Pseudomonas sp.]|uniref:iron transporter n=1 Tax=Pseudomonas sp. TaxID=306 RepID=UPI003390E370
MARTPGSPRHAVLLVLSRSGAALLGAYLFTYGFTAALARLLPLARVDAVIIATLLSLLVFCAAQLWAFAARSAWQAWCGALLGLPLAAIGLWPVPGAAG